MSEHEPDPEFVEYMENQVKNPFLHASAVMQMERVFIDQRNKYEAARAQGGKAVGVVDFSGVVQWFKPYKSPPAGTELYTRPGASVTDVRPEVAAFARAMQYKLDKNKHKDGAGWPRNADGSRNGWHDCTIEFLAGKLSEEVDELLDEVEKRRLNKEATRNEAADVGNIAMMLADVCGALSTTPQPADNCSAWPCWSCKSKVSMDERGEADGDCPKCGAELDLDLWPNPPGQEPE